MTFGDPVPEKESIDLVHGAIDLGINFIDTANVYEGYSRFMGSSGGVAEEILGKALKGKRDKVILATKVGSPHGSGPHDAGLSGKTVMQDLDTSLKRLKTDFIDLYIIHWPDPETPLETTLSAMETAMRQGKILSFGVSNHYAAQLCELLWIAEKNGWPKLVSSQIPYSMLRREFHNDLEFCANHDIAVTPYQMLQGGLLTGKYKRGKSAPENSRLVEHPGWIRNPDDAIFDVLEATETIAGELNVPLAQYAMAWTLAQPAMSSMVVGVKTMKQIEDAVAGAEIVIPEDMLVRQDAITPAPVKHQAPFKRA